MSTIPLLASIVLGVVAAVCVWVVVTALRREEHQFADTDRYP